MTVLDDGEDEATVWPLLKYLAPMILLLQFEEVKFWPSWQIPLHFLGAGGIERSLKLGLSGHIPVSSTPIIDPRPNPDLTQAPGPLGFSPKNS